MKKILLLILIISQFAYSTKRPFEENQTANTGGVEYVPKRVFSGQRVVTQQKTDGLNAADIKQLKHNLTVTNKGHFDTFFKINKQNLKNSNYHGVFRTLDMIYKQLNINVQTIENIYNIILANPQNNLDVDIIKDLFEMLTFISLLSNNLSQASMDLINDLKIGKPPLEMVNQAVEFQKMVIDLNSKTLLLSSNLFSLVQNIMMG